MDRQGEANYRQINKSLNICAFEDYLTSQQADLPSLPDVKQVTPRVLRILGQNAGKFTLQGTNTYIVGTGHDRLLIDTSNGGQGWRDLIESTLQNGDIRLCHVLLTHWHGDHTGGVPDLISLDPAIARSIWKSHPDEQQKPILDGQVFEVEGATVRALHTPGHSEDHMCFILEEENAMFTGDNILGHGTTAFEDLSVFMASLQRMQAANCTMGHPAHGETITNLHAKIITDLAKKYRRERQIMQALGDGNDGLKKRMTLHEIVADIYGHNLDQDVRDLALAPFTDEHLRKLALDGKVAFHVRGGEKRWFAINGSGAELRAFRPSPLRQSLSLPITMSTGLRMA